MCYQNKCLHVFTSWMKQDEQVKEVNFFSTWGKQKKQYYKIN